MSGVSDSATTQVERRRGPGRPFQPGQSGNPGGFPKDLSPLILECRRLALTHAPHAIERLAAMLDSKDERVVVAAAEGLLDRAGLRPYALEPERVEVTATVDVDALRASLAARAAALVVVSSSPQLDSPGDSQQGRACLPAPGDGSGDGVPAKGGTA